MSATVWVDGTPYQYEAEAEAGVNLGTGCRWWGTHVKVRPGITGRWLRFNLVDVHPFDTRTVERGIIEVLRANPEGGETK